MARHVQGVARHSQAACFFVHAAHDHLFFRIEGREGAFRVPVALENAGESERAAERRFAWYMQQQGVRAAPQSKDTIQPLMLMHTSAGADTEPASLGARRIRFQPLQAGRAVRGRISPTHV